LKKIITIWLILLVFTQQFSKVWIYVSFKINQDEIAKNLCIKRNIENNTCQGCCHLKKQLEQDEEETPKQLPSILKLPVDLLFFQKIPQFHFDLHQISSTISKVLNDQNIILPSFVEDIFKPPQ
jgi:hypothetical protein